VSIECEQTASPLLTANHKSALLFMGSRAALLTGTSASEVLGAETAGDGTGRKLDPRLQKFFAAKERHARSLPKSLRSRPRRKCGIISTPGMKGIGPRCEDSGGI